MDSTIAHGIILETMQSSREGHGPHTSTAVREWKLFRNTVATAASVSVDTDSLGIASITAVSKYRIQARLKDRSKAAKRVNDNVDFLARRLADGCSFYGVTTGFGGSADLQTRKVEALQQALVQHQQSGILPIKNRANSMATLKEAPGIIFMPEEWVRGTMLVRCKSLLAGYSGARFTIIELLMAFLNHDMIPLIPLRGSISASGDLQPLSYIAGILEGNPDCYVWTDDGHGGRALIPANVALEKLGSKPVPFGPKEALAVLNGTAASTAVAALAMQESHSLAIFSQVLTAMGVEAMRGSAGSFNAFFDKVRPHRGQREAAANIRLFLTGSQFADLKHKDEENHGGGLKQDRYALRTSPQWIGPQLEDLLLAHEQITVESNSTTDNPLIDMEDNTVHHGGNFQAASITSAMEKTRSCLQAFGRMLFSQCTELINPAMNNGLPPNLAADDPSTSYTMKGADINVAAYMSELAYLANPVSSHVQTAENGNQAINSLALISSRYTHMAVDCLSMICATYLYVLCQALDIRAMNRGYLLAIVPVVHDITAKIFESALGDANALKDLQSNLLAQIIKQFSLTTSSDSSTRFLIIAQTVQSTLTTSLSSHQHNHNLTPSFNALNAIAHWTSLTSSTLLSLYLTHRAAYFASPDATPYLGLASGRLYAHVRHDLQVPFHKGLADRPSTENGLRTIGSNISVIYQDMRCGRLYDEAVMPCLFGGGGGGAAAKVGAGAGSEGERTGKGNLNRARL